MNYQHKITLKSAYKDPTSKATALDDKLPVRYAEIEKQNLRTLYRISEPCTDRSLKAECPALDPTLFVLSKRKPSNSKDIDSDGIEVTNEWFKKLNSVHKVAANIENCESNSKMVRPIINPLTSDKDDQLQITGEFESSSTPPTYSRPKGERRLPTEKAQSNKCLQSYRRFKTTTRSSLLCKTNRNVRFHFHGKIFPAQEIQCCAHCHVVIGDVAFFNGTQQLCAGCADLHFHRVTKSRLQKQPIGYKEFKNVSGDTIYLDM